MRIWFFRITVKIGIQVYKAVLDRGATLSIGARRLLKEAKIRKTKTVAIRVGDGRTINSLGGVDVTVLTRSRGGPGHGMLRRTRTSKQAGKALCSQGHPHARVM